MPKIKIVGLPKFVLGGNPDCEAELGPGYVWDDIINSCVTEEEYNQRRAVGSTPSSLPKVDVSAQSDPYTGAPLANKSNSAAYDMDGCIIGQEVYSVADGKCIPIGNAEPQKINYNQTLSTGTAKTGPGTGVNPGASTTTKTDTEKEEIACPPGYKKNKKGECEPGGFFKGYNTFRQGLNLVGAGLQAWDNAKAEKAFKAKEARMRFSGLGYDPGKQYTKGHVETVSGVEWPNLMTPPNEGMFSNAFYGSQYGQVGGEFMFQPTSNTMKIRILETPDALPAQMKYGGQSGYGLDLGWKIGYTDMSKTSSDHITQGMSEDKGTDEPPVLEAEGNETLYKPADKTLHTLHGKRHSEGGIPLTQSQVSSESKDVPSFIFSDTKDLKIKDKKILSHFGIKKFARGGVTPAEISKKFDLNKFKAILEDKHKDTLAKDTAQLMLNKNEKKLAELASVQEMMKGKMPPSFAQEKMNQSEYGGFTNPDFEQKSRALVNKFAMGGFLKKFVGGGPDDPENDPWIEQILKYESTKGSATGTGLSNYGIKKSKWESKYPDMWRDNKITEDEAKDFFRQEILPDVKDYPIEVRKRLADYIYNTGRNPQDLLLLADNKITLDDINSNNVFTAQWNYSKDDVLKKLNDPNFIKKLDDAKLNVYKTTGSYQDPSDPSKTIKYTVNNPNPAFDKTWKYRVKIWDTPPEETEKNNVTSTSTGSSTASGSSSATGSSSGKSTGSSSSSSGNSTPKYGDFSNDYNSFKTLLMSPRNEKLRETMYEKYKEAHPKNAVSKEKYFNTLLTAQEHIYSLNDAYKDKPENLRGEDWDAKANAKKRNKRYKDEITKLGYTPLSEDDIKLFQRGFRDLVKLSKDGEFYNSFGQYFKVDPRGVKDEVFENMAVSPEDGVFGNTTNSQFFRLAKPIDEPKQKIEEPNIDVNIPGENKPKDDPRAPRWICDRDAEGKPYPKETTGTGIGYSSPEEAMKYCGQKVVRPPYEYLLPDQVNMLAQSAIFPEMILPFAPNMSFTPGQLNLEDWRAKAAQRFSTQYAAPSEQLAQYTSPQGLAANLSFLAGQTGQQMAAEDIAPTISRNVDRANQFGQQELARQSAVNQFNLGQQMDRYKGWAVARQQYRNALRKYMKDNSDAFTRAWNNRMMLGDINDSNSQFYKSGLTGRNYFYNPNTMGVAGLPSGSSSDGSDYASLYKQNWDKFSYIKDEKSRARAADNATKSQFGSSSDDYPTSSKRKKKATPYDYTSANPFNFMTSNDEDQMG